MKEKIIGIKELHRGLKDVSIEASRGVSFLVVKNSKPVFRIMPLEGNKVPSFSKKDLKKLQFKSRDKNLSQKVDKIAY